MNSFRISHLSVVLDELSYLKAVYFNLVRASYWKQIETGKLLRLGHAADALFYSIDDALDHVKLEGLQDWAWLKADITGSQWQRAAFLLISELPSFLFRGKGKFQESFISSKEEQNVTILLNFIDAHDEALHKLDEIIEGDKSKTLIYQQQTIVHAAEANVKEAKEILATVEFSVLKTIVTRQAARYILNKQYHFVHEMAEEGLLKANEADMLYDIIAEDVELVDSEVFVAES